MTEESKALNRSAREKMKLRLLNDIMVDMTVCEIENWDKTEYLEELRELISGIGGKKMLVASRRFDRLINLDNITNIRTIGNKIQAYFDNGNGTLLEQYKTAELCELAISQIKVSLDLGKTMHVMSDEEDLSRLLSAQKYRHIDGKKTKGHGGS